MYTPQYSPPSHAGQTPGEIEPERVIGVWRRSMSSPGFWIRVLFSVTLYYWMFWERNKIELTNRRVTQYRPLLVGGSQTSITIENITEVQIFTSPFGALLGFSDLRIETAGTGRNPEISFQAIAHPDKLKYAIFELQDRYRQQYR